MGFLRRAWLYIMRQRGRSAILVALLAVMATCAFACVSLARTADRTRGQLRHDLGGSFSVTTDYSDANPYLVQEEVEGGVIMYSTRQLSAGQVGRIRALDGVTGADAAMDMLARVSQLDLFAGTIPIDEEFADATMVTGVWRSEEHRRFADGEMSLAEGRHLNETDSHAAIIGSELASRSGLSVGDTLRLERTDGTQTGVDVTIVGLFDLASDDRFGTQITTYDKLSNRILTDLDTAIAFENGPAVSGFTELDASVDDPERLGSIMAQATALLGEDADAFMIDANDDAYRTAADSLDGLAATTRIMLAVTLAVGLTVLSLTLLLWSRTRRRETGVMLALGITRSSIVAQHLAETMMLAGIACGLSALAAGPLTALIGDGALPDLIADAAAGGRDGQDAASALTVTLTGLDVTTVLIVTGTGLAVAALAVALPSIALMRVNPREILARAD